VERDAVSRERSSGQRLPRCEVEECREEEEEKGRGTWGKKKHKCS